jgi:hypothetical protein
MFAAHAPQPMELMFKQPARQILSWTAQQIESILKARNPSRISAIALQITLYSGAVRSRGISK